VVLLVAQVVSPAEIFAGNVEKGRSRPVVAGYAPDYRIEHILNNLDQVANHVTDVILFSLSVERGGQLNLSLLDEDRTRNFVSTVRKLPKGNVRVHLCVGGGGRSQGFMDAARSASSRKAFSRSLAQVLKKVEADGIDFDWEAPQSLAEVQAYTELISETKRTIGPGILLGVAVHAGQDLGSGIYSTVDRVNLMTYDMVSPSS
jgi:hypothetical protein